MTVCRVARDVIGWMDSTFTIWILLFTTSLRAAETKLCSSPLWLFNSEGGEREREKGTGLLKSLRTYSNENVQKKNKKQKKQAADEWHLHLQKNSAEHSNAWCTIRRRNARTMQSLDDSYGGQKWKLTKKTKKNQLEKKCSIENRDFIHTSYTKIHCFISRWSPSFIVTYSYTNVVTLDLITQCSRDYCRLWDYSPSPTFPFCRFPSCVSRLTSAMTAKRQ